MVHLFHFCHRVHTRKEEALGVLSLNLTGCPEPLPASKPTSAAAGTGDRADARAGATGAHEGDSAAGPPPPLSSLGAALETAMAALAARVAAIPVSVPLVMRFILKPEASSVFCKMLL